MKRRDFLTSVALGAAAGSIVTLPGCLPHQKTNHEQDEDTSGKAALKETYSGSQRIRSGIALGGLGTGSIELRKDGQFYNWSIMNNFPFGAGPVFTIPTFPRDGWEDSLLFFLLRYQVEGEDPRIKLLQINNGLNQGAMDSIEYYFPWMSPVSDIEYRGRFPFINMKFSDPDMPFVVEMEAFSPFIPHDVKNSSLPGVYFNFKVISTGSKPADVMLLGSMRNLVSYDTYDKYFTSFQKEGPGFKYYDMSAGGVDETASAFGHMGMASLSDDTTWYLGWEHRHPYYEKLLVDKELANIDDTENRNHTDKATGRKVAGKQSGTEDQRAFSSIALTRRLEPGEQMDHSFIMTWYFPNNYGSFVGRAKPDPGLPYQINQVITTNQEHYYQNYFNSSEEVAEYMTINKDDLTLRCKAFTDHFYASDADPFILDQINSQLNTFITSSRLTKDGTFAIREGMTPDKSWGPMATTDVSLYGDLPVLFLFPELQKSTMRAHKNVQTEKGEIAHGLGLDLTKTENGTWGVYNRIDLPGQFVQMTLRDFFYTNDRAYLEDMWPAVKKAINYILEYRDDDGNQMPYMKGIESSYDNFPMYGMAAYIQSQWLCAIASAIKAAEVLGDQEALNLYSGILKKGSELMEEKLWNGEYYRLYNDEGGTAKGDKSEGCLTDQIIGQWVAHLTGLGYLFKEEHVKSALKKVLDFSYKPDFGLRNCTWPEYPDRFPIEKSDLWVDQANTTWSGVELAFASFLIYEGFYKEGLEVAKTVNTRYRKASLYWDHQEFGGHYYRPMSAWGIVNALLGMSVNQDEYTFSPKIPKKTFRLFFSTAKGTSHYIKEADYAGIESLTGELTFKKITFNTHGLNGKAFKAEVPGNRATAAVTTLGNSILLEFDKPFTLHAGETLKIS